MIEFSPQSPQPLGTPVTVTVSASDTDPGAIRFRFRFRPAGGAWSTIRDYSPASRLVWSPIQTEGQFDIEASVLNHATGTSAVSVASYRFVSRVTGASPAVSATTHPLVALYSAPGCAAGSSMRVRFKLPADPVWQSTPLKPCAGSGSMNFYVAGMLQNSTYQLSHDLIAGPAITPGPVLIFTTGTAAVAPPVSVTRPLVPPTSLTEGITFFQALGAANPSLAVDSSGRVVWYSPTPAFYMTRTVAGGTFLQVYGFTTDLANSGFQEIDLAGNIVKDTNAERLNDQLAALGKNPITMVHHEVRRIANGGYLLLAETERISDAQGPGLDIAGDMVLVLDADLQIRWVWDAFEHLDVSRKAVLGETCKVGGGPCVLLKAADANDWMHANSAALTPDGNIVISVRHHDAVYKIAYADGTGDGHVIWTLGKGGDFTIQSNDPYPWFSHQHDASFLDANTLSLYDNGNTRVTTTGGGNSRGQVLQINESARTVTLALNTDLGSYSPALGSAQRLSNGNYEFGSGTVNGSGNADALEVTSAAAPVSSLRLSELVYRTYRMDSLTGLSDVVSAGIVSSPPAGSLLTAGSQLIGWNSLPYADSYRLLVGSAPGLGDYFTGQTASLSLAATGLPTDGRPLFVRVVAVAGAYQVDYDQTYNGLRFVPLAPCRVADTRIEAGSLGAASSRIIPVAGRCAVPPNAAAYSMNVTAVPQGPLGYLTVWAAGQPRPYVSTLNSDGRVKANAAIVPAGTSGAVAVYVTDPSDVVLDINGYFVAPAAGGNLAFYPLSPCRVADTRLGPGLLAGPFLEAGQQRTFPVPQSACGVPATARAYSLNFTAVPHGTLPYLSTWPTGQQQPLVSTLNSFNGAVVANAAVVPAGLGGSLDVYAAGATDVIIDINGYYAAAGSPGALAFYLTPPCRVADTRSGGGGAISADQTRYFDVSMSSCGVSSAAEAYSLNATVIPSGALGYLTLSPAGEPLPFVSTLNSFDGSIVANAAVVPAGGAGDITAFVTDRTDLILDINGYFAP